MPAMLTLPRIYLDNAATSWPKPEAVYTAVDDYQRRLGAPAGRSAYDEAIEVDRLVEEARVRVARLLGVDDARRIVFAFNGTDALNMAIHGLVEPGDDVITTVTDHNSVLRPLRWLEEHAGVSVTRVGCNSHGVIDPDEVRRALRPQTSLIAMSHASNVTGALQPVAEVAARVAGSQALLLVDAAQSLGHVPISFDALGCDLVAAPGHKGLLGPLGTGILAVGARAVSRLRPLRQGGTGTRSEEDRQPDSLPDRCEAGNHNVPGIVGLAAGVKFLTERGLTAIQRHEQQLCERLLAGLSQSDKVTVYGPPAAEDRVAVVSLRLADYDPQEVAATLAAAHHIDVRAGLHCAPLMHRAMGTLDRGGTVRLSLGPFTTTEEVDAAAQAVVALASASVAG